MKLLSYAQNFEDVMLWRALGHVREGFYIDLGAWSPDHDSVTKAFYERGWCGINVEPNPTLIREFECRRTRDINLQVAVGATAGTAQMNFMENSGLSTLNDAIAGEHQAAGWANSRQEVRVVRLEDIFRSNVRAHQAVHFLKIDVEGLEGEIVRGFPWSDFRPWILVIEATRPMTQEPSYEDWEPILVASGYRHVYADGLNRFYVAEERSELAAKFSYPPNYFDDFELARHAETERELAQLKSVYANLLAKVDESEAQRAGHDGGLQEAHRRIAALLKDSRENATKLVELETDRQRVFERARALEASTSWRITGPLRRLGTWLQVIRAILKRALRGIAFWGLRQPRLVSAVHAVLRLAPPLHRAAMLGVDLLVSGRPRRTESFAAIFVKPKLMLERFPVATLLPKPLDATCLDALTSETAAAAGARWDVGLMTAAHEGYRGEGNVSVAADFESLNARDAVLLLLSYAPMAPARLVQIRMLKAQGVRVSVLVTVPTLTDLAEEGGGVPSWVPEFLVLANAIVCFPTVSNELSALLAEHSQLALPQIHQLPWLSGVVTEVQLASMANLIIQSLRHVLPEYLVGLANTSSTNVTVDEALERIRHELQVFHHA